MTRDKLVYVLLCICLLTYITLRAIYVPLVHDEVATYIHYVHQGEFIPGKAVVDANNHILNSVLSIGSDRLFGTSPLSLRLANLVGFLILAFYLFKLASRIDSKLLRWCFIAAILGNHYLMEFHALSRGYGISIAALLATIWHIGAYFDLGKRRDLLFIFIWMGVGLGANLSLLFVMLLSVGFLFLHMLVMKRSWVHFMYLILMSILLAVVITLTLKLKEVGALYYGQGDSFWEVTMETLSLYLTGEDRIAPYVFLLIALLSLVVLIKRRWSLMAFLRSEFLYHLLLFGSLVGVFLSHFIFEANYPEDRVGLYLYPLLIGSFVLSLDKLRAIQPKVQYVGLILLYFPLHFLTQMNLDHVDFWFRERIPESFYGYLTEEVEKREEMPTLSGYNTTSLVYFMAGHLAEVRIPPMVNNDFPSPIADYIIVRGKHGVEYDMSAFDQVLTDETSGNILWRRKHSKSRTEIQRSTKTIPLLDEDEFYEFVRVDVPADKAYAVAFDIRYATDKVPADVNLVLSSTDSLGATVGYIPHALGWRHDKEVLEDSGILYINGSGGREDDLVFYLWNIDKVKLKDLSYTVTLYQLD